MMYLHHAGALTAVVAAVTDVAATAVFQVLCELSQYSSLVYLDPLGSLLDWHCGEAAAAAATLAFMSGAVLLPQMLDSMTCQVRAC
jgi:hypothetical protein